MVIAVHGSHPVQIRDVARVERGPEPVFTVVTAQGREAVLLNVQSQAGWQHAGHRHRAEVPGAEGPGQVRLWRHDD